MVGQKKGHWDNGDHWGTTPPTTRDHKMPKGTYADADDDFDGARQKYKFALENIPRAPLVQSKRDKATKLFADVSARLAHQRATEGRREEAKELLTVKLGV